MGYDTDIEDRMDLFEDRLNELSELVDELTERVANMNEKGRDYETELDEDYEE